MNWGYKIAIVYSVFVVLILAMVYKSSTINYDLVTEDYYAEELKYQNKIEALKNTNALDTALMVTNNDGIVSIQFPSVIGDNEITGNVHFYKPDNKKLDQHFPVKTDNFNKQTFNAKKFGKGSYSLKIEWLSNGINYYQEEEIFL